MKLLENAAESMDSFGKKGEFTMKIGTWIKYEENYLPPRCRKLRYRECEDYINVNLKEVDRSELQLAFEDNSFEGVGKIYFYKGKLWCKTKINPNLMEDLQRREKSVKTALDYLMYCRENCSTYFFFAWDRENYGVDTSREAVIKMARNGMKGYILVDGELFEKCAEPRYVINTFGLGHNHGGTGMFCEYYYNHNISKDNYFSALEGEQAVAYANIIAANRGDTKDIGKFEPFIICHMPELVRVKPNKQHGNGNKLLNSLGEIINESDNVVEAGLFAVTMCMSGIEVD